jgi:acetyl-CoA C-acetyltransferase
MYLARVAAVNAGVSHNTPALTLNRVCGSGLQAIVSAAQSILLGDTDIAIGAGTETMSRAAYIAPGMRWGDRMGDATMTDMMLAALHDPFHNLHMGETADQPERVGYFTRPSGRRDRHHAGDQGTLMNLPGPAAATRW